MKVANNKMLQLLSRLDDELQRETSWRPAHYDQSSRTQTSGDDRDKVVRWLTKLNQRFQFHPETLALSIAMLDCFLTTVKAHPKYLWCIAVSCFYLAAKTLEEDEVLPVTTELVRESGCGRSVAEVNRMEREILDKLNWVLHRSTPLSFLHIFHALLLTHFPHLLDGCTRLTTVEHVSLLTDKLHSCMCHYRLSAFPPSTIAIALLSLELQLFRPDWLSITVVLQGLANVDSDQLISCREAMSDSEHNSPRRSPKSRSNRYKCAKRKVDEMEEAVYDGIRHLYGEETCGREARQDSVGGLLLSAAAATAN